jgi:cell division protein FtsB
MYKESKFKYLLLTVLLILAGVSFTRTVLEILKSSRRLDATKNEITALEQKKSDLEESIAYKKTADFIEETARNELNLVKPGEEVFVVSNTAPAKSDEVTLDSPSILLSSADTGRITLKKRISNLQDWWELFF